MWTRRLAILGTLSLIPAAAHAETGDVLLSFPSSFPSPDGLMWDGAFLWATDCATSRIDRVDPLTGAVVGAIDVTGVNSDELAWDGTAMWVGDHTATEMPGMGAPPPRLYRVDPVSATVLTSFAPPGPSNYPMGIGWDGTNLWNVDPWDALIFRLDPDTGEVSGTLPSPAGGACGMTWDGACLWVTDAATNGRVYHIDPANGEVISSFDGPGGAGHQTTGIAWDGQNLWVHDEASGRAAIYKLVVDDITEGGRCAGALQVSPDAGAPSADAGSDRSDAGPQGDAGAGDVAPRGGCGCVIAGAPQVPAPLALGGIVLALLALSLRLRASRLRARPLIRTRPEW